MTIRAIVFDLGHTLWDITPQPEALARAYAEMRSTMSRQLGRSDLPAAGEFQRSVRDVLHQAAKTYAADSSDLRERPPYEWLAEACRRLGLQIRRGSAAES